MSVIKGAIKKLGNNDFEPIVKVRIGRMEEFDFVVDTGSSCIVMNNIILDRLTKLATGCNLLRPSIDKEPLGVVGQATDAFVYCGWVEINGFSKYMTIYGVINETQNLLGRSVLTDFRTVLDKDKSIYLER